MNNGNFLNTSHQTITWFGEQNRNKKLILRPPYQRRPVWNDEAKSFLIDSILRGYPVPEIYVQSKTDQETIWEVVDGQQRLRAILEFLDDDLSINFDVQKITPLYSLHDTPWFNKKFSELHPDEQRRFRRYKLIVRDLEDVEDEEVRHLFHRLNQSNVVLNAQELRYSLHQGGLLQAVEELIDEDAWDHFRVFTKLQRRRMLDSEFISELITGYLHWPQNKKDNLDHYYRIYSSDFPFAQEVKARFHEALVTLQKIFPEPKFGGSRWYKKSDFYTLFLSIARGKIKLSEVSPEEVRERLIRFGELVERSPNPSEPATVAAYRDAVSRAATDRGRRVRREEALVAFLKGDDEFDETSISFEDFGGEEDDALEGNDNDIDDEYVDNEKPNPVDGPANMTSTFSF